MWLKRRVLRLARGTSPPHDGYQGYGDQGNEFYAVALLPGDVTAPVPEPQAYAMMLVGLGAVVWATRRRARLVLR